MQETGTINNEQGRGQAIAVQMSGYIYMSLNMYDKYDHVGIACKRLQMV